MAKHALKIIPLGGLGEIGKNMMALEYADDIIVIDAGVMFPEEAMLGIDLIIPDITYLLENRSKIRGIVITHGHEDHIGALPYVLKQLDVPIYATPLAHGLISMKLKEHKMKRGAKLNIVEPGGRVSLGAFNVELFRVCHSIPDAVGLAIGTPLGTIVHTGDFKVDHTPVDGKPSDFTRLAKLGSEGVLLLLSDSTYVELQGYTPSEQVVGDTLERIMAKAPARVIVCTFASLISRVQQVINAAAKHDRRVCMVGRSMVDTAQIALKMGYLQAPPGLLARLDEIRHLPRRQVAIVATGTQGEPTSALVRMANHDHPQLHIVPGDTVVMSATAIPGNEKMVNRTINNLFRQGASVLYDRLERVHVHGHASQEELKMMINLTKPRFFVPIHGEYRHLALHAQLAQVMGIPKSNTFVLEDGDVLELTPEKGRVSGKVASGPIYVDGLGAWDMTSVVLRDRRMLSKDGIVVVILAIDKRTGKVMTTPDVISFGFVDSKESPELMEATRNLLVDTLDHGRDHGADPGFINIKVKDVLSKFLFQQTKRRPMILPVALEL